MVTYADLFGGQMVQVGTVKYRLKYTFGSEVALHELGVDTNDQDSMRDPSTLAKMLWAGLTVEDRARVTWRQIAEAMPLNAINDLINEAVRMISAAIMEAAPKKVEGDSKKKLN